MVDKFLSAIFTMTRGQKRLAQLFADALILCVSLMLAMVLRLESFSFVTGVSFWLTASAVIAISLVIFYRLGFYETVIRYISANAAFSLTLGIFCSAVLLALIDRFGGADVPRTVPGIYAVIALLLIGGVRFGLRALFNYRQRALKENVFIYGAGSAGRQLLRTLQQDPEFNPVAFFDDATQLHGVTVAGLRVYPPNEVEQLTARFAVRRVLLAMPSATQQQRRTILSHLGSFPLLVQTIPGISDILSGKAQIGELRHVAVEDLLGRDPVPPMDQLLDANLRGKAIMVTGAGGSIGSELCRQAIERGPRRLVLVDVSEFALYSIDTELRQRVAESHPNIEIIPLLMSVQAASTMTNAMRSFEIDTVYHAAAYKHVPLVEHNVVESVQNNIFGTRATAMAAIEAGVAAFILVSTDKAVRPTNYMGATKRVAELICQALAISQKDTLFSMVRFGNVLGSSGSVIPHFRQQIAAGGPVTVTHRDVTRYFMTIPEAALLVIQAGAMARGGDVFVLDMGEPVAIVDLAERMVRLSGLTPYFPEANVDTVGEGDIAITFTQLRPGEKLYEELLIGDEVTPTEHPRIMSAQEERMDWAALEALLEGLERACQRRDLLQLRALLVSAPTGFKPDGPIVDYAWNSRDNVIIRDGISFSQLAPTK